MSYRVLPAPVKAKLIDLDTMHSAEYVEPGSIAFGTSSRLGSDLRWDVLWYCCPCGCGDRGALAIGNKFKPSNEEIGRPTWKWDGNREEPTLTPSINHVDHWHGYLTAGYFKNA